MAETVYILCALTSLACAGLLLRSYRRSRMRLILWTSICFIGLTANNILLFIDLVVVPGTILSLFGAELALWRVGFALAGVGLLLFGLIQETT